MTNENWKEKPMKEFRALFLAFLVITAAVGCKAQVQASPPPSAVVTWPAAVCPTGQTCGAFSYIVSRAVCPTLTTCPAVATGNYTPLNQATPAATTTLTDSSPQPGVYEAYVIQVVEAGTPPIIGLPNVASAPALIASYPPTLGAATVTTTAELAPPVLPDQPAEKLVASNEVPRVARATVKIRWR